MKQPTYSAAFFAQNVKSSLPSALVVLKLLFTLYKPKTVVDFGCGSGAWLTVAHGLGAENLYGFDGSWVNPRELTSNHINFTSVDFEKETPPVTHKSDLAISVEVIEHISSARSDCFLDALCSSSDVIVFSAAIPYQGGTHHVNEQPQSHWITRFACRGYDVFDIFRPAIWNNVDVRWWFRQNIFLYVRNGTSALNSLQLRLLEQPLRDVVHPANYERKIKLFKQKIKDLEAEVAKLRSS
jgi:hypothetical protein